MIRLKYIHILPVVPWARSSENKVRIMTLKVAYKDKNKTK